MYPCRQITKIYPCRHITDIYPRRQITDISMSTLKKIYQASRTRIKLLLCQVGLFLNCSFILVFHIRLFVWFP